jgi:hypothetical protein
MDRDKHLAHSPTGTQHVVFTDTPVGHRFPVSLFASFWLSADTFQDSIATVPRSAIRQFDNDNEYHFHAYSALGQPDSNSHELYVQSPYQCGQIPGQRLVDEMECGRTRYVRDPLNDHGNTDQAGLLATSFVVKC